ncbi:SpaA isopeptide-forming pilin-related protein [Enterococcus moraviensis]|uniref:SpaA isopeptide-forming pilin-related protein n=1 Tax=Enterococcus moraviensis TaxID=155617 RepID=UPI0031408FB5
MDKSAIPADGGDISFTNRATLSDDNDPDGIDAKEPISVLDANGKSTEELHAVDGHIKAQGIAPGAYYLVETKAPNGYIINTDPIKVVITEKTNEKTGLTITDTLVNYQGSAELMKVGETKEPLAGAEFKVVDVNGKDIQTQLVSNDQGNVQAKNLVPGTYFFVETKAPAGYQLSDRQVEFKVPETNAGKPKVISLGNYQNNKEPEKPTDKKGNYPKMNESANQVIIWLGFLLISFVGLYYYRKIKKN